MRLVRLVVAGIVLGAVAGFAAALLRPRTVHRSPVAEASITTARSGAAAGARPPSRWRRPRGGSH